MDVIAIKQYSPFDIYRLFVEKAEVEYSSPPNRMVPGLNPGRVRKDILYPVLKKKFEDVITTRNSQDIVENSVIEKFVGVSHHQRTYLCCCPESSAGERVQYTSE